MDKTDKIFVAGHGGMVGSAILRKLKEEGYSNLITASSSELDLRNQQQVDYFFKHHTPNYVILAAAKVGGINANNLYRAEFLYDNLMIQSNVIHSAYENKTNKLLFLGSSCIYPKLAPQPLKEEYLLTGPLEITNEPYAIAKIAGIKMCQAYRNQYGCNFIAAMPTNLYGPNDNYDLNNSHVVPALIRKFHNALEKRKEVVEVWGSGKPLREFLHVDDLADACYFLMLKYNGAQHLNIGTGEDISIRDLALLIKDIVKFDGNLEFNSNKPDGTPRKLMDVSKIRMLGWKHRINLRKGIESVYNEVKLNHAFN